VADVADELNLGRFWYCAGTWIESLVGLRVGLARFPESDSSWFSSADSCACTETNFDAVESTINPLNPSR
jgi:hypothetical protein